MNVLNRVAVVAVGGAVIVAAAAGIASADTPSPGASQSTSAPSTELVHWVTARSANSTLPTAPGTYAQGDASDVAWPQDLTSSVPACGAGVVIQNDVEKTGDLLAALKASGVLAEVNGVPQDSTIVVSWTFTVLAPCNTVTAPPSSSSVPPSSTISAPPKCTSLPGCKPSGSTSPSGCLIHNAAGKCSTGTAVTCTVGKTCVVKPSTKATSSIGTAVSTSRKKVVVVATAKNTPLANTGIKVGGLVALALGLLIAGGGLLLGGRRKPRHL